MEGRWWLRCYVAFAMIRSPVPFDTSRRRIYCSLFGKSQGMNASSFGSRLLVVDNEPSIGRIVKRVGESLGFEVVATEDAAEFLKTARLWQPTLIMLDLNMPSADGIELLRALAAERCLAKVVVSGGEDIKVVQTAQQLGHERGLDIAAILPRPVQFEELLEFLSSFKPVPRGLAAADLLEGVAAGQLFLNYQPQFDCRVGRITGVEALVRWRHPVHGIVFPDQFIPLAEETDCIPQVTDWVFAEAANQAAAWRADDLGLAIGVNLSAKDVEDIELPERLQRHCIDAGIDPDVMVLELTETGAMRAAIPTMDALTRLRLKGFRLSIDDFGTGYSSFAQLQRMPFSELKIDKSFVMPMTRDKSCRVIAEIMIDLARKLHLNCVAEGVEDKTTLAALAELGCDLAQGYHFSRPVDANSLTALVRQFEEATFTHGDTD
jgi:EAL domain-containing protein (putative c-di-GMP-specific phosphodiesterase class I)